MYMYVRGSSVAPQPSYALYMYFCGLPGFTPTYGIAVQLYTSGGGRIYTIHAPVDVRISQKAASSNDS